MCRLAMEWDDPLTEAGSEAFCDWRSKTEHLSQLKIKRCFQGGPGVESDRELHVFSDASEFAYGAAVYLKVTTATDVCVSLVMGKSRVAPLKMVSIPRLELTAATVAAKLAQFVVEELDIDDIAVFFWTDSMTVLRYLRNVSTRFKIFVAHRVQQIQDCTDVNAWNYVPTDKNPADLASRGINPDDATKLEFWLQGPQFLKEESQYTRLFEEPTSQEQELEIRQCCAVETAVDLQTLIARYSSLYRLQRADMLACEAVSAHTFTGSKRPRKSASKTWRGFCINSFALNSNSNFPRTGKHWKLASTFLHRASSSI